MTFFKRLCGTCRQHFTDPLQPGWTVGFDGLWRCPACTERCTRRPYKRPKVIR